MVPSLGLGTSSWSNFMRPPSILLSTVKAVVSIFTIAWDGLPALYSMINTSATPDCFTTSNGTNSYMLVAPEDSNCNFTLIHPLKVMPILFTDLPVNVPGPKFSSASLNFTKGSCSMLSLSLFILWGKVSWEDRSLQPVWICRVLLCISCCPIYFFSFADSLQLFNPCSLYVLMLYSLLTFPCWPHLKQWSYCSLPLSYHDFLSLKNLIWR